MKVQLIIPAIACIFILLAIYHLAAAARRNIRQSDDASRITVRVRKRLFVVFLLVGAGLFGYYWLAF